MPAGSPPPPHRSGLRALTKVIQPDTIREANLGTLGMPNSIPLVYEFDTDGRPLAAADGRCYVPPLYAHYLGEACVAFNRLDADGNGALDAAELGELDVCATAGAYAESAHLGIDVSPAANELRAECGAMIVEEADCSGTGFVDFNEYIAWEARRANASEA